MWPQCSQLEKFHQLFVTLEFDYPLFCPLLVQCNKIERGLGLIDIKLAGIVEENRLC